MSEPPLTTIEALLPRYQALFLDAYGVLNDSKGPVPGAPELIRMLREEAKPFWVLTNDASRSEESCSRRFGGMGMEIPPEQIVTSGALLERYFREAGLQGSRCVVLGTADSKAYVERAGGTVLPVEDAAEAMDVLLIGDDSGYPFMETVNAALTGLLHRLDSGVQVACLLPNPDLIYPAGSNAFGVTSGGIASIFEAVLAQRYPEATPAFVRLGKPHAPLFAEGLARAGTRNVLMIGDTLETDILGAARVGIDSALVETGVSRWRKRTDGDSVQPTWRLAGLRSSDGSW